MKYLNHKRSRAFKGIGIAILSCVAFIVFLYLVAIIVRIVMG